MIAGLCLINRNKEGVDANADAIARLKMIAGELDSKSQEDEKKVSDLNVTVENLHMNVSL